MPAPYERNSLSAGKVLLFLFTIVLVGRVQEAIPVMAPLRIGLMTGGLAGLAWLMAPGSLQDKFPFHLKEVKYVLMLLTLAVLILPLSVWPGHSFEFVIGTFSKLVLFFLLVLFWTQTVQDVRRLIWASCLGISALVLMGLLAEAASETYDANDLALVLAVTLPLLIYLFTTSRFIVKPIIVGMMLLCLYGLMLSRSRGGFLSLLVVGALILWRSRASWGAKVLVIIAAAVVFGGLAGDEYWSRIRTIWSPETEYDTTAGGRTEIWKTGVKLLLTHPWGIGADCFAVAEGLSHGGAGKWSSAHNTFLQVGVELGAMGLIVFVLLLARTMKQLRWIQSLRRGGPHEPLTKELLPLAAALETSLWGFIVGGFFLSQAYAGILYALLASAVVCTRMCRGALMIRTDTSAMVVPRQALRPAT